MRVAVAGAGVGGLALALALHARGIAVRLVERAAELGEAGAGVQLGPNAVKVLDRLGLGEALRAAAFEPEAAEVRDLASGGLLLRNPLGEAARARWGAPYLQLHRSDLQALLLAALRERGAAELTLGRPVEAMDDAGALVLAGGERIAADVAVAADGVRSAAAASLLGDEPPRFTGWTAWRAVVPRERVAAAVPPVAAVWTAPDRHLVHYPVRGGREVNLVAVTRDRARRDEAWTTRGDPAELARRFADAPAPGPQLIAGVGEVWRWALYDRPPRPRWSRGRATLLGDAAHPMLPFLAQGAAVAVEDAWVLAARLGEGAPPEAALARYEADRRARTARVQAWSRRNARLFHLPPPAARLLFGAAALAGDPAARFDWLYGWEPPA